MNRSLPWKQIAEAVLLFCAMFAGEPNPIGGAEKCDILLRGGTVHRGDGQPPTVTDIAIEKDRIVAIGEELDWIAGMTIDCSGQIVCPGFIDLHTHSDDSILERNTRQNTNYLMQGCTTIITGNCGGGHVDVKKYLDELDAQGAGTNVGHLLPHGSLRRQVMGSEDREPSEKELAEMKRLAEKAMEDGAFGMSTGLIYIPGTFAKTDELVAIAATIAKHGGIYASHIRGEGSRLLDSVNEAIEIGDRAKLPVHVSHFKASGTQAWGTLHLAAKIIEQARSEGKTVTADQYPYIASSTSLEATLLPDWCRAGGRTALKKRLADRETRLKIHRDVVKALETIHRIQLATCSARPQWIGKSLDEIAKAEGIEVAELVLRIEELGGASIVNFGMNEEDVRMAMKLPWVATASDGSAKTPSASMPHPRSFGTYPRKIGYYAHDEKVLAMEAAIRSASALPAEIIGLSDRGRIQEEMKADIVVFDPDHFRDQATYDQPYLPPTGLTHVLVNGRIAVYAGHPTGVLAGKALRKPTP